MVAIESKIDVKKALRVFEKVVSQGKRYGDEYQLNGISALSDFDGYTIVLRTASASLTIQFHSKFSFEYSNLREMQLFLEKLESLDRSF